MDRQRKNILYAFCVGVLFAFLIFTYAYRQPEYEFNIVNFGFQLITEDGKNLGWAFSTISLKYKPSRSFGRFLIIISTYVSEPYWRHSISSRDIRYNISFCRNSRFIVQIDGSYLGALNPDHGRIMYNTFTLPSGKYPMDALKFIYGKIILTVKGAFYNITNNKVYEENTKELHIFVMPPSARFITFLLLIITLLIGMVERSGPTLKTRFWKKRKSSARQFQKTTNLLYVVSRAELSSFRNIFEYF